MTSSLSGPWLTPAIAVLNGAFFYPGKTAANAGHRYLFGWTSRKSGETGYGDKVRAGNLVRQALVKNSDGTLAVQNQQSIVASFIYSVSLHQDSAVNRQRPNQQKNTPFKIRSTHGNGYTYRDLKPGEPVVIICFDTDCDHCKALGSALQEGKYPLEGKQLIWITYQNMEKTIKFDQLYKIFQMPGCAIGSEGHTFVVQKFYNIKKFPYIVLFNKAPTFIKALPFNASAEQLAKNIRGLH